MVKWLTSIVLSNKESDSFYHYRDNRVLPPPVLSKVDAEAGGWWEKPEYIINDRNLNSAILSPLHGHQSHPGKPVHVSGYAYNGSGQKVIRMEVTTDSGATWQMANFKYGSPAGARHGTKYWCWYLWELDIMLDGVSEICVRAWDCAQNTQPSTPTWNLLGMMNNPWYRLKLKQLPDGRIEYHHPVDMASGKGWLVELQTPPKPLTITIAGPTRLISAAEVKKHNTANDLWIILHGKVYDITKFLEVHPGGKKSLLLMAGQDATEDFDAIHGDGPKLSKEKYCIGILRTNAAL